MKNLMLTIQYDGTNYAGWQRQKNVVTVEGTIEDAISDIVREDVDLIASGRTDRGVHALGQVANFKTNTNIPINKLIRGINSKLPDDISIVDIKLVDENFHSRYYSHRKRYKYVIWNGKYPNPINRNYSYHVPFELDLEFTKRQAQYLIGTHDFSTFKTNGSSVASSTRTIFDITIEKKGDYIILEIEGSGFLYNMVRIIVGTLIDMNKGKISKSMDELINEKDRKVAGHTALACGLFLKKVFY